MSTPITNSEACAPPCVTVVAESSDQKIEDVRWFADEILPHEPGLRGWLRKRFPWVTDIDDLLQDSYVRLFKARQRNGKIDFPKSYLFATARNAAIDASRSQRRSPVQAVESLEQIAVLDEKATVADALCHDQDIELLAEAIKSLPKRQRLVLTLCKLRGLSYREIAEKLGISEPTVSNHLAKGLAHCREYLREHREDQLPKP